MEWVCSETTNGEATIMDFKDARNQEMDALEYNQAHAAREVTMKLQPGDEASVKAKSKLSFIAVAQLRYKRKKPIPFDKQIPEYDFFFRLTTLKPLEADIFNRLMATRDFQTNIGLLAEFPKNRQTRLYAALKGLQEKELIAKIKVGEYMINPLAIVVPTGYRIQARAAWDKLGG